MKRSKRAIVSGAAGFLGSHLCDRLLAEGFDVTGVDNLLTGDLRNIAHLRRNPKCRLRPARKITWSIHWKPWMSVLRERATCSTSRIAARHAFCSSPPRSATEIR